MYNFILTVGFPSQLKKGVDKHHLFLDLCCHLSRDSRGLILEVKSERAFAHLTITFMKNHVATWSCANAISFHVWIWNKYPKPISIFCGNRIWWITYSLYICDGQSDSLKLKYTYKCKRMSSIGILLTYTTSMIKNQMAKTNDDLSLNTFWMYWMVCKTMSFHFQMGELDGRETKIVMLHVWMYKCMCL